jgi:hypothetical protein
VGERRNRFAEERERFTVALGGRLVAYRGEASGGSGWRLERQLWKRWTGKEGKWKQGEDWFFEIFGPDF